ncbi:MAG: murein biosynthesis integral membrane protein MurJ [Myxococcales bacterium]|nr:murein biosynthesis integral membrane protein MurJ [Myxococcales bacterium]
MEDHTSPPASSAAAPLPQAAAVEPPLPESGAGAGAHAARGAFLVAAGIFLSRLMGLIRHRVFAHYFGSSMAAAAFMAALRIPNFLQNLFGEGAMSASFIPVYAQLLGKREREEADKVAGAVFGVLSLATSLLVAAGVWGTPYFIDALAPGLQGRTRELTVTLVRILFPGIGLLVVSAWCLGILNSHRKFFLSYAAPVVWNGAIIATLLAFGGRLDEERLAVYVAWGTVAGSVLQFGVQLPSVLALLGRFRPSLNVRLPSMQKVLRGFGPAVVGRGVVQISAFLDLAYASLVTDRAIAVLSFAQTLYLLPVSLFGMSISAAELPAMSQATGTSEEVAQKLRERLEQGLVRLAFFVVPSAAAFLLLGDVASSALYQTGRFSGADARFAWYILMGSGVGLLAATMGRLYSSAFYALHDTKTPLKFAVARVAVGAALALYAVRVLPGQLGVPVELGAIGITAASGIAAWIEYQLLRRTLARRIGDVGLGLRRYAALWGGALLGAAAALLVKWGLARGFGPDSTARAEWGGWLLPMPALNPVLTAAVVLGVYGSVYFAVTHFLGVPQAGAVVRKLLRRRQ